MDRFEEQQLKRQLRRVEARLTALEQETFGLGGPPIPVPPEPEIAPSPPPVPVPPPRPKSATPPLRRLRQPVEVTPTPAPTPARTALELERVFGVAVLGRIGVGAVLLAAAFFAKLTWAELSEVARVFVIYGLSAAFVGAGFLLRERVASKYIALLWGGGAAAAYLAAIAARLRYDLVDPWTGLLLLVGACALGQWLARTLRHQTLASIALVGAFAAPLLVGDARDHRTFLLAYLLLLHGWAAWTEREWKWNHARVIGVLGACFVGGTWLVRHGAVDTSTYLHIHGYMLGLALPEILAIVRGERVDRSRANAALVLFGMLDLFLWFVTLLPMGLGDKLAMPGFGWVAGAGWVAAGVALMNSATHRESRALPEGLVTIGGMLLTLGCFGAQYIFDVSGTNASVLTMVCLSVVSLGLLALRRVVRVGDLPASFAASLAAIVAIVTQDDTVAMWLGVAGMIPAAALLFTGRSAAARMTGIVAGTISVGAGLAHGMVYDVHWIAAALAAMTTWLGVAIYLSHERDDLAPLHVASGGLLTTALIWIGHAYAGKLMAIGTPILDPTTLAGLYLGAVAGWFVLRKNRLDESLTTGLWMIALGIPLLAGQREVTWAVQDLAIGARDTAYATYLVAAGLAIAVLGQSRKLIGVQGTGVALVLAACAKVLFDVGRPAVTGWRTTELTVAAAGVIAMSVLVNRRSETLRMLMAFAPAALAVAWCGHELAGNFPAEIAIFNVRFLAGLLVLGTTAAVAWTRRGIDGVSNTPMLGLGMALGYLVGLAELLQAVKLIQSEFAWPDVLVSVYTTLYAAGLLFLGFRLREERLRYAALAGFLIVVCKVGLHDLAAVQPELRIFVTGVLGLVLLGAAYVYAKRKDHRAVAAGNTGS